MDMLEFPEELCDLQEASRYNPAEISREVQNLRRDTGFLDKELGFVNETGPAHLQQVLERFAGSTRAAVEDLSGQVRRSVCGHVVCGHAVCVGM
jgi:hypothetical protein